MVGVTHGTNRVGLGPHNSEIRWRKEGPQMVKWSNRYNSATDCPMWLKFCKVIHSMVLEGWLASKLEPKVEFHRQGAFYRIPFWGHVSGADQDIFTKFGM